MDYAELTRWIAIWGAITGTVGSIIGVLGLWLNYKKHWMDKALLKSEATFNFSGPGHPEHTITARSIGRRTVTLDAVHYKMLSKLKWPKLLKRWYCRDGKWTYKQPLKSGIKLAEGEKSDIRISVPGWLLLTDIFEVTVVDQTGKHWPVKWPSMARIARIATSEQIDFFEDKNEKRVATLIGHRLGERYFLEIKFVDIPVRNGKIGGRSFNFHKVESYRSKFDDVKNRQCAMFLAGEVEEII